MLLYKFLTRETNKDTFIPLIKWVPTNENGCTCLCFRVPLPYSFWKPFLCEKFLLAHLNDANNQTCQTHISLIIVITLSGSHLPWEICIPASMSCFFCRWPPCNHMSSQCWRGGWELNYTISPIWNWLALQKSDVFLRISQNYGQEWKFLYLSSLFLLPVYQMRELGEILHVKRCPQFHFPSLKIIDSSW